MGVQWRSLSSVGASIPLVTPLKVLVLVSIGDPFEGASAGI